MFWSGSTATTGSAAAFEPVIECARQRHTNGVAAAAMSSRQTIASAAGEILRFGSGVVPAATVGASCSAVADRSSACLSSDADA
jgi:hypothetical protein